MILNSILNTILTRTLLTIVTLSSNALARDPSLLIPVGNAPASNAGVPLEAFVSFSIEFSSFPDFAGNTSNPNVFSNNLLNNIGNLAGTKPFIRVGGNTQDYAIFNSSLRTATVGIFNFNITKDYPTTLTFGPSFFESYHTWPNTKFSHGFNLGRNSSAARNALIESVPYACKALENGRLAYWELGNEPDLYKTSAQGHVRPPTWNESDYVNEWLHWSRAIHSKMQSACPDLASTAQYKYYAPSFAGTGNSLDAVTTWKTGLDVDRDIAIITQHNYISGAETPGVTLQGTLMNHTSITASAALFIKEHRNISALGNRLDPGLPFILGETNSLFNQGRPGLSNTFGAALWGVDFNLWCAANDVRRVHMHQGTNYRYQAWQPIDTPDTARGTKAPYYGNVAVAAFLGDITRAPPSVVNLPLPRDEEAAYAAYVRGRLARLMVVNMQEYNATDYNSEYIDHYPRPDETYTFRLPRGYAGTVALRRLSANGSDAITGVTFDGYSFNYELARGKPVLLRNVTRGETARIGAGGRLSVTLPRSSALIVDLEASPGGYWDEA